MHHESAAATEAPPIADRSESKGFWSRGWPVLVLGFITVLLIRACIPSAVPPPAAPFYTAAAARDANTHAMQVLEAVTADTPLEDALKALNLPVVNFASGSATLPDDAKVVLQKAAAAMKVLPAEQRFEISGHTDNTGTAEANMLLSRKRAQAVVDFLLEAGVPRERLAAHGHGDARPVASNATEEGRFHNRRIEVNALAR
jgi:outer membrane protein OmpA-like peptidoglycan-associated protein